jgi:hypothetical protein
MDEMAEYICKEFKEVSPLPGSLSRRRPLTDCVCTHRSRRMMFG